MSDLHIDVNRRRPFLLPDPRPDHDALVIAGDIMAGMAAAVRWIVEQGLNDRPVIYVAGNHEFYGGDRQHGLAEGLAEAGRHRNIHVLERQVLRLLETDFIGATLWTDYHLFGDPAAAKSHARAALNDHALIRLGRAVWMPADAAAEHALSRSFIDTALREVAPGRRAVVVSHHAPSLASAAPQYRSDLLTAAFASDCANLAERADLWIHGHMHAYADYRLGRCRVVANPRGYVGIGEAKDFVGDLVITV